VGKGEKCSFWAYSLMVEKTEAVLKTQTPSNTNLFSIVDNNDKRKQLHQSIFSINDEFKITEAVRIKEISAGFIKQVQELDPRGRESERDLREMLIKIDRVQVLKQ
jgi:hypothetical protein